MAIDPTSINAYRAALARVQASAEQARGAQGAGEDGLSGLAGAAGQGQGADSPFMKLVRETVESTIETNRAAEKTAIDAAAGKADLSDVVTAVANAEATLQTVVTVRDRIIQAYQEIMRMPI